MVIVFFVVKLKKIIKGAVSSHAEIRDMWQFSVVDHYLVVMSN